MAHGITCTKLLGKETKNGYGKAYQDGRIKMRMITKGKRDTIHGLAPLCDTPSTCPFLKL